jgi:hypothetical protein
MQQSTTFWHFSVPQTHSKLHFCSTSKKRKEKSIKKEKEMDEERE